MYRPRGLAAAFTLMSQLFASRGVRGPRQESGGDGGRAGRMVQDGRDDPWAGRGVRTYRYVRASNIRPTLCFVYTIATSGV